MSEKSMATPRTGIHALAVAALLTIYIVWGSTYLGIKFLVQTMPPLLSSGIRFMIAGGLLLAWQLFKRKPMPTASQIRNAAIAGTLLFLLGNGSIVLALQRMDSAIAALIIALTPMLMVLMEMRFGDSPHPGFLTFGGMALGLTGLAILLNPFAQAEGTKIYITDAALVIFGITCWAAGSIFFRNADTPASGGVGASIQMLSGGMSMTIIALLRGELGQTNFAAFSLESVLAFFYLIFIGSILGFSAYNYLLKNTVPALTGTYAFVNPVVAMVLGALIGGEVLTSGSFVAAAAIICGVILITVDSQKRRKAPVSA